MRIQAIYHGTKESEDWHPGELYLLDVKTNLLAGLHNRMPVFRDQHSIRVEGCHLNLSCQYHTITDFLQEWRVRQARTLRIGLPFLRRPIGAGHAFAWFAEKLPLWIKSRFTGCEDRELWWSWCLEFVPWNYRRK